MSNENHVDENIEQEPEVQETQIQEPQVEDPKIEVNDEPDISTKLKRMLGDCPRLDNSYDNLLVAEKIALLCAKDAPEDIMTLVVYPALKDHFHFRNKTCDEIKTYVEQAKVEEAEKEKERLQKEAEMKAAREALLREYAEHGEPGKSVIVSVNKEFENVSKKVSLCFTFDNSEGFHSERCATELLIDGESVACVKSNFDITHEESKQAVKELQNHISEVLNINNSESNNLVKELMELANTNHEKILCLSKAYVAQQEAITANKEWQKRVQEIQKADKYASLDAKERALYFGCIVPNDYRITPRGVDLKVTKWDRILKDYVTLWVNISSIRIMITGRFQSSESTEIVELTYIDNGVLNRIYAPLGSVIGIKEFKETLRPRNIRLDDIEIKDMVKFFNGCITANPLNCGSAFKNGYCYTTTGWKEDNCTRFVAGRRMFDLTPDGITETECVYTDESTESTFDPRGSIQSWMDVVSPLLMYDRTRFTCYAGLSSILLKFLNVDSFTIDNYGGVSGKANDKSGSGKTTLITVACSMVGNVLPGKSSALVNTCYGTANFVENLSVKFTDLPLGLDESTKLNKDTREDLAYRISNKVSKGRASDGKGNIQQTKRKCNVALTTGENPLIPRNANIGTKVRCISLHGGIGVSGIGKIAEKGRLGVIANSGHFLKLFLEEFNKNREYILEWFNEAHDRLEDSTEHDLAKRQAAYFAAIEVAGKLLENIFERLGIEKKNASDVVTSVWNESVAAQPIEAQWYQALSDVWDWYHENDIKHFNFQNNQETFGWVWYKQIPSPVDEKGRTPPPTYEEYLEINMAAFRTFMEKNQYDVDQTLASWRELRIINVNKPEVRKDGTVIKQIDKSVKRGGKTMRIVQIDIARAMELLNIQEENCEPQYPPEVEKLVKSIPNVANNIEEDEAAMYAAKNSDW